jgi:hypothetical protein
MFSNDSCSFIDPASGKRMSIPIGCVTKVQKTDRTRGMILGGAVGALGGMLLGGGIAWAVGFQENAGLGIAGAGGLGLLVGGAVGVVVGGAYWSTMDYWFVSDPSSDSSSTKYRARKGGAG